MFERTALPDGPRVISARLPGARSLSVAAFVLAGSRLETPAQSGIAHFMEHITFKGTTRFPTSRAVSEAIEGVGGVSNAATDRESTVYWTKLPVREATRAFTVLGELVARPLLRPTDIDHEREIIVEEIRSYRDDPGQHVFTVFDELFFGDTPLGREIAGSEASVRAIPAEAIHQFWSSLYNPANVVVAVAGDLGHDEAVDLVREQFGQGSPEPLPSAAPAPTIPVGRFRIEGREISQAHICLGVPALRRDHPDQWTLELLDTILGRGSSSRLFLEVREAAGLAYDVHSFETDYADAGLLQIYAGVDPDDLERAVGAIMRELGRLRDEPVGRDEFEKARAYARGRLELRLEETQPLSTWLGAQEALHERVLTLDDALVALDTVTPAAVHELAGRLFHDELLSLAVIAPRGAGATAERALRLS